MGMTQGLSWWRRLLKRREMEQHLDAELRFHFDGLVAENLRAGMSEPEARRSARLEFGGVEQQVRRRQVRPHIGLPAGA